MYHYVREVKNSKYPNLKGLEFNDFKKQINYFIKNFNVLSNEDFVEIIKTKKIPKKKSILLTFDDGYIDHWKYVYPYLKEKKIKGIFYPPVRVIQNKIILDINKVHFILAKELNRKKILKFIFELTKKYMNKNAEDLKIYKIRNNSRYDDNDTNLIKRLLQVFLPLDTRKKITNIIFKLVLNTDEKNFSKKLYMSKNNILEMYKDSMTFGSHGNNHCWLEHLNYHQQLDEIKASINFYKKIGVYNENFSFCYPHGSYDLNTMNILKKLKIKFALTNQIGSINKQNLKKIMKLPRFDTNDFI